jgi:Zn-dependent peptidase ImmA (M78 family)
VTRGDLHRLASYYFVSVEAMARRLANERLIPAGTWDRLRQEGFQVRETDEYPLGPPFQARHQDALPPRYVSLAVEAWQRAELSEGQLAQMLRTDRISAREIIERVQGLSTEEGATADLVDWSAPLLRAASH